MKRYRSKHKFLDRSFIRNSLLLAIIIFGLIFFSGFVGVYNIVQNQDSIDGVHIDGIDVSGMSYEQAEQKITAYGQDVISGIHISLDYMGQTKDFTADDLGVTLNEKEVLDEAYGYNKKDADSIGQRYNKTIELLKGKNFETQLVVDQARIHEAMVNYAQLYNKDAIDATASFNKETREFTYTPEEYGVQIDIDTLSTDVLNMLNKKDYSTLLVPAKTLVPNVTEDILKKNTVLMAQYETTVSNIKNKNTNIQLMCNYVNGLEIKPGETASLNGIVGERTEEKGFMPAPAIANGAIVDDVGGGICQFAGTLYNAALLANMEIVERVRHTTPSGYLPIGQDATLNWDNKDLKLKNTTDFSIFVYTVFENQKLSVQLYGQPMPEGVTIEVKNDIVKKLSPGKMETRYTNELPVGVKQTIREAQDGYVVNVYRSYWQNGALMHKELISQDTYPALNKLIFVGSNTNSK